MINNQEFAEKTNWLLNSKSYVVYENTVSDKNENRYRKGTSHKFHGSYDIHYE